MTKLKSVLVVIAIALTLSSCYTLECAVGKGAQGSSVASKKQWFALWGLVPLKKVDTQALAGGAQDYTIKSQHKFGDYIISTFTGVVTISCLTVEVKK
jgi:PBP1b-binding outer membrane lipoprotein LpoB